MSQVQITHTVEAQQAENVVTKAAGKPIVDVGGRMSPEAPVTIQSSERPSSQVTHQSPEHGIQARINDPRHRTDAEFRAETQRMIRENIAAMPDDVPDDDDADDEMPDPVDTPEEITEIDISDLEGIEGGLHADDANHWYANMADLSGHIGADESNQMMEMLFSKSQYGDKVTDKALDEIGQKFGLPASTVKEYGEVGKLMVARTVTTFATMAGHAPREVAALLDRSPKIRDSIYTKLVQGDAAPLMSVIKSIQSR